MSEKPTKIDPTSGETLYPCLDCDVMRTKAEGGTVFTVCEVCWDRRRLPRDRPIPALPKIGVLFPKVDHTFERYFEAIGYRVGYEGRMDTGDRWYEIYDERGIHFQISMPAPPIAELLADLPHLVDGKPGIGPTRYWMACDDNDKLRELLRRTHLPSPRSLT